MMKLKDEVALLNTLIEKICVLNMHDPTVIEYKPSGEKVLADVVVTIYDKDKKQVVDTVPLGDTLYSYFISHLSEIITQDSSDKNRANIFYQAIISYFEAANISRMALPVHLTNEILDVDFYIIIELPMDKWHSPDILDVVTDMIKNDKFNMLAPDNGHSENGVYENPDYVFIDYCAFLTKSIIYKSVE